ncbi:MAG: ATP-dependent Clp protease ATP-binding subunit [Clostridia bacterium]|nr:ATP-dependent Clp protease ATP-binding subunit [Clostridia bacterium]
MCARCKKRPATVYIMKLENNVQKQEGLCLVCAKELGIKPVNDMMTKMGITEEELENMEKMFAEMLPVATDGEDDEEGDDSPTIPFSKIMKTMGFDPSQVNPKEDKDDKKGSGKGENREDRKKKDERKHLNTFCHNLTQDALNDKLDKIIGRERELERVIQILSRRQKNNPCLIGEPGVGKTAIAEALAQKIVKGDVPYKLRNCEIYLMDLTALVAGTQFRGQFEARINGLLKEVKQAGNIILVIDEIHNIVGTGNSEGSMNAANILKPALSRGEIQVIGATTLKEYRKYIEKDAALERRFQPVKVEEPSIDECIEMIKGIKHYYEIYHGVKISDEMAKSAVIMSERYITDRFLPDKAIDLIDEACSHIVLHAPHINERHKVIEKLAAVDTKTELLNSQIAEGGENANENNYKQLAELKTEKSNLLIEKEKLDKECENTYMTKQDLAGVIEIWTGIPASNISEEEFEKLASLEDRIKSRIIGQDDAVKALSSAIQRNRAGVSVKKRPASFIFAGPTGVGKTELVKTLAKELFNSIENLVRLDMSEFMEKHSVSKIIGSPPGYVGYDEAGQLTEKIRRSPYSVVLFDEIEKAHPDVLNILLQILDEGKISDSQGRLINFENTVIIMTTNAGATLTSSKAGFGADATALASDKTEKALSQFLRPEFINRIDEIITFRSLEKEDFVRIAKIMLDDLKEALVDRNITFKYTDDVCSHIAEKAFSKKYGARNMRRFIQTQIEDKLAHAIIFEIKGNISGASVTIEKGEISVKCI